MNDKPTEGAAMPESNAALRNIGSWAFVIGAALLGLVILGAIAIMGTQSDDYYRISIVHFSSSCWLT